MQVACQPLSESAPLSFVALVFFFCGDPWEGKKKKEGSLPTGHACSQARTLHNATSASSRTRPIGNGNVNNHTTGRNSPAVGSEGRAEGGGVGDHSLLNDSDKDYATCPDNLLSLARSFWRPIPLCWKYSWHAGCPGDRHRVKPKANARAGEWNRDRDGEGESGEQ